MPQPRAAHSASLLRDGRVLLAGGCHTNGCEEGISGDALLFDPRMKTFTSTGSLVQPRVGHRALRLRNDQVVLIGGWTADDASDVVEAYDPTSGRFVRQGKLLHARDGFSATPLADGNILVAGGYSGAMRRLASVEVYDPRTGKSHDAGAMSTPRMSHTATLLADGRVLIAGGSSARGILLDSIELFDPATGRFMPAGHLQKARHKHAALRVGNDVLLIGGAGVDEASQQYRDSERWSARDASTRPGPAMQDGRYKFLDAVVRLRDGRFLVAGSGRIPELLDSRAARFTSGDGSLGTDLSFTTATPLLDGSVLIAGGYGPDIHPSRSAWLYQP
ncbi:MAG: kelch repeat-containing protein [Thermomonas sp.]